MINEELKEALNEKIEGGEFDIEDIPAYLTLFCEIGNEVEELQDEVEGWDRRINFVLAGMNPHWIAVEDGRFTTGEGSLEDANLVIIMDAANAALVFAG
ncbi:MAG: hypothetical protein ACK2UN_05580, partial [Candidatus Promineifilaceae bacterium]